MQLARLATRKGSYDEALDLVEKSLVRNYHSHTARHLKAVLLRKLGRTADAHAWISASLAIDNFNYGCLYEATLLESNAAADDKIRQLQHLIRGYVHNYIEYTFDYAHAGLYTDASNFLKLSLKDGDPAYPMVLYYLGHFAGLLQDSAAAGQWYTQAAAAAPDYCFPNRIEDVPVLQAALAAHGHDAKAHYYLGNYWYANRQYAEAIACWEKSVQYDPSFPTAHRNLALAYYNKQQDAQRALKSLQQAFALNPTDARVLMELDQLYKQLNKPHAERLALLEKHIDLTVDRDDLYLERVTLYNLSGKFEQARQLLAARIFHPWEGGEGKVVGQYLLCHLELAKEAVLKGAYGDALELLDAAETYPHNLGEGKLYGAQENDISYLKGCCYEGLGQPAQAEGYFRKSTQGLSEPAQAIYYNDQQPDKIFYQGLGWKKLGTLNQATTIFQRLIDFGAAHLDDKIRIDYFAVSLPDLLVFDQDLDLRNRIHCHYLMGLGHLGLGNVAQAEAQFQAVLVANANHLGAFFHRKMSRLILQPSVV